MHGSTILLPAYETKVLINLKGKQMEMKNETLINFKGKLVDIGCGDDVILNLQFYTDDGVYIGGIDEVNNIIHKYGIKPELAEVGNQVCSIGKSLKDGKWYGWSHRAIYGFEIGSTISKGDCCASSGYTNEYLKEHPEEDTRLKVGFTAQTEEDCKKMAIAFAASVS